MVAKKPINAYRKENMPNITASATLAHSENGRVYELCEPPIGQGTYATVHNINGDDSTAAKLYRPKTMNQPMRQIQQRSKKIREMSLTEPPNAGERTRIAWPMLTLSLETERTQSDDEPIYGYLMPKAPSGSVSIEQIISGPARYQEKTRVVELLQSAVETLHQNGIVVGDVNSTNAALAPNNTLWLFDVDGWQFTGINGQLYYAEGATTGYTHPAVLDRIKGSRPNCIDLQCPLNGQPHSPTPNCKPRSPAHDDYAIKKLTRQLLEKSPQHTVQRS